MNKEYETIGIIDDAISAIWTTNYTDIGDFELYLPATAKNIDLLVQDRYLYRESDYESDTDTYNNVMIIGKIQLTTNVEQGNFLIVTGESLETILTRRIIWSQTKLSGTVEDGIRQVITDNIINPSIADRKISDFVLGARQGFGETSTTQVTYDNVAEWIIEVCATYEYGFKVVLRNKKFVFELYKGTNRSYSQAETPVVIFAAEYDNLENSDYQYDKKEYKNIALVAGEGEGLGRRTKQVGSGSGLGRRELYVDAREVQSNDGEINSNDYGAMLTEKGAEKLAECGITELFSGEVSAEGNYTLNRDYFLGDLVHVINEYGIATNPRITSITDVEDENGRHVLPVFSKWEV